MKLAVVIIHYNSSADLDRCLESLVAYAPAVEHDVYIVDNQSTDEGLEAVHRRYPQYQWLFNNENLGYSRGANLGMNQVEADYYLILNPDIVVQPGALDNLLAFAERTPRAGIVGPQLLNEDHTIQDSCRRFYTLKTLLLRRTFLGRIFPDSETVRRHLMQDFDHRSSRPVDWVIGGCMLVRRTAMERTGPMDERFFLYFEDVDWCHRMWQAGFEVVYTPESRFIHRHRRASAQGKFNRTFWLHLGSLISFYEKWGALVWLLKKWREPLLVMLLWALDMAGMAAAFAGAYGLRKLLGPLFNEELYPFSEYRPLLLFSLLVGTLVFLLTGRYTGARSRRPRRLMEHLKQVGVVSVLLLAATYLGHLEVVSRAVWLLFIPLFAWTTSLGDAGIRAIQRRLEKGYLSLERTLLVGPPGVLQDWLNRPRSLSSEGIDVAGYVWSSPETGEGQPPLQDGTVPWLGTMGDLYEAVQRYRISQVIFWQRPVADSGHKRQLARLRRLRVRLCWNLEDVWLLTSGARPERIGGDWNAVQSHATGSVLRGGLLRLGSFLAGLLLLLLTFLPWLFLRLVRVPRGSAAVRRVGTHDPWGHDPTLSVAVDRGGRSLPLVWQLYLAADLVRGRLNLTGPRALAGPVPEEKISEVVFWRRQPAVPGLTGDWARNMPGGPVAGGMNPMFTVWKTLWSDPGGFGVVEPDTPASGVQPDAHEVP